MAISTCHMSLHYNLYREIRSSERMSCAHSRGNSQTESLLWLGPTCVDQAGRGNLSSDAHTHSQRGSPESTVRGNTYWVRSFIKGRGSKLSQPQVRHSR